MKLDRRPILISIVFILLFWLLEAWTSWLAGPHSGFFAIQAGGMDVHLLLHLLLAAALFLGYGIFTARLLYQHRQDSAALRESGEKYRVLFESAPMAYFLLDQDRLVDCNEEAARLLGYNRSEILGSESARPFDARPFLFAAPQSYSPPLQPDGQYSAHAAEARIAAALEGYPQHYYWQLTRKDGSVVDTEVNLHAVVVGGRTLLQAAVKDISRRRRAEREAVRIKRQHEMILNSATEGICSTDIHGLITFTNPAAASMLDWQVDNLIGKYFERDVLQREFSMEAQHNPDDGVPASFMDWIMKMQGEAVFWRRDGTNFPVIFTSAPIFDELNQLAGAVIIFQDVAERKRAEERMAQLLEAERSARQQMRELTVYLQTVSENERAVIAREIHDELGQALTALHIDLSWLAKRLPPGDAAVERKMQGVMALINQTIVDVQKIATELRPGLLDDLGLAAAVEWQVQEFSRRTAIDHDLFQNLDDSVLDRDQTTAIFRILQETLTNITRHARATLARVRLEEVEGAVRLIVEDNGMGIDQAQVNDPRALGLMGMRERARACGGKITFETWPGGGTRVTLVVPVGQV